MAHAISKFLSILTLALPLFAGQAFAQTPSAIVEDVNSPSAGVAFMDYVTPGKIIKLDSDGSLVLGYLRSCWRESIVGGTVSVGQDQSDVKEGKVMRTKEQCDGGQMALTPEQAKKGGMSFRARPKGAPKPKASVTVFSSSPVFEVQKPGQLVIERLDQAGAKLSIDVKGAFHDSAKGNAPLAAGGLYRASHAGRQVVFQINASATHGAAAVLGRLVRFQPAK